MRTCGGLCNMEEAGRCGTPRRGKLVDQLVMSCAVDGEPGLAAVVGKHKGGNVGTHGQHLVDDKAGLPAPGAEHHHIGTLCLDGPQVAQHSVEGGILRGYRNDVPAIHHRALVGLCTGHGVVGGRRGRAAVLLRLRCAAADTDAVLVLVAQRGNEIGALTGLLAADAALLYRVAAFRAGGGNGGLDELMIAAFGHPFAVLTCLGHRVRAIMTYIGHFYFCTVLDVVGSNKFILAVLGSTTALNSRSAIANGSARTIMETPLLVLGTAGGLDLRFAANDHFAGATCAGARCRHRCRARYFLPLPEHCPQW